MLAEIFMLRLERSRGTWMQPLGFKYRPKPELPNGGAARELMALGGRELWDIHLTGCDAISDGWQTVLRDRGRNSGAP